MKIHVICSEQPHPSRTAYAIEVFHQLEAMLSHGYEPVMHIFQGEEDATIKEVMNDNAPILIEGYKCCPLLPHPSLNSRRKIVRLQYIQHIRTKESGRLSRFPLWTIQSRIRAWKEKRNEVQFLRHADLICAITKGDQQRLMNLIPGQSVAYIPCHFDLTPPSKTYSPEPFVLCHNYFPTRVNEMRVIEQYIIKKVAPLCPGTLFVILQRELPKGTIPANVKIIGNTTEEYFSQLIQTAQVHLLLGTSTTGIGMDLLITLAKGQGQIVANRPMLYGHSLSRFCTQADEPQAIAYAINKLMQQPLDETDRNYRLQILHKIKKAGISRLSLFK